MLSNIRNLFKRTPPDPNVVVLQLAFKKKILKSAYRIISNPNYYCPPEVKKHFINKYSLEPGRFQKIINSICKPASKIIASFTVEWTISPALSALFLEKVIAFVPSLSILSTGYLMTITVSIISVIIYPILIITSSTAAKFVIKGVQLVANKVHKFVMARFFPRKKIAQVNLALDFANLTSTIRFAPTNIAERIPERFYIRIHPNGTENIIEEDQVRSLYKKALRLERYNLLLEGNRTSIKKGFQSPSMLSPSASSDDNYADMLKRSVKAAMGLEEVCSNAHAQFRQKHVVKFFIKECTRKDVELFVRATKAAAA